MPVEIATDKRMYKKQDEAIDFAFKRYALKYKGVMLAMEMGCLAGDTEIKVMVNHECRKMRIDDLWAWFSLYTAESGLMRKHTFFIESFDLAEDRMPERVINGIESVMRSGYQWTYQLFINGKLANGEVNTRGCHIIRATENHMFLVQLDAENDNGYPESKHQWRRLKDLKAGDYVWSSEVIHPVRIEGIERGFYEMTYDIACVDPYHCYSGNGFIVHNSGKSRCAIEIAKKILRQPDFEPKAPVVMIACPKVLLPSSKKTVNPGGWVGEFKKWWPEVSLFHNSWESTARRAWGAAELCRSHQLDSPPLAIAAAYDSWRQTSMVKLARAILATERFRTIFIADESHRAKSEKPSKGWNTNGSFTRGVSEKSAFNILLTGTPMPHGPEDLWSQFYCVDPGEFGKSYYMFKTAWFNLWTPPGTTAKVISSLRKDKRAEFETKYAHGAFTCRIDEVTELPPISHNDIMVELSPANMRIYKTMETELFAEIQQTAEGLPTSKIIMAPNVLAMLNKCSQMTGGTIKTPEGATINMEVCEKLKALDDIISDLPPEEPVVIFCRYIGEIDRIGAWFEGKGRSGDTKARRVYELSGRRKDTDEWRNATGGEILIVQEQAGGVGVDLSRARYAFFYSVNYSYGDFAQAVARLYRKGQERHVVMYHLIAEGTIDEDIGASIKNKRDVSDAVLRRGGWKDRKISMTLGDAVDIWNGFEPFADPEERG